ncbi:MAG TPA: transcriptional regulator [Chitinophagaceae bacterium]|nr:transcriptional regulator [Chitinophagaceae bacterium]
MTKILIIEDNTEIRENTAEILELAAYEVVTAANGKEGVEVALQEKPDLIVCDIMMPVLDGYGVLHALQKNDALKGVPFIFLTAKNERTDLRKGMELGADDYITKPFDATELLNAIEGRLKKNQLLQERLTANADATITSEFVQSSQADVHKLLTENRFVNTYKKKQLIYKEGNWPSCLFYVVSGKLKTYKINDDGKVLIIGLYNTGDFVGYVPLLEGTSYKESAQALGDCELALIRKEEFDGLMHKNVSVAEKFVKLLAKNVREREEHLLGLAYNSLRKKVADALVQLNNTYNTEGTETFTIQMSRENLATIAGTATESLIRTLSDFKAEKLVALEDGNITILNVKKLKNLMN